MKTERPTDSNILLKAMATEMKESGTYNIDYSQFKSSRISTAAFEAGFSILFQNWYKEVKKEYQNKISRIKEKH